MRVTSRWTRGLTPQGAIGRLVLAALAWAVAPPLAASHLFPHPIHEVGSRPLFVLRADLDADGRDDLVVANFTSNDLSVLLGDGDGAFEPERRYEAGEGPYWMALGDLDGDGRSDLVVANFYSNDLSLYAGRGDGTFAAPRRIPTGPAPYAVVIGRFDDGGRPDLAVSASGSSSVVIHRGEEDWLASDEVAVPAGAAALAAADLGGDGRDDLLVTNADPVEGRVSILLGAGDGQLVPGASLPVGLEPEFAVLSDLDADGRGDLVTANTGSDDLSIRMGEGAGSFGPETRVEAGIRPYGLALEDLDRDGDLDIAASNLGDLGATGSGVSVLPGLGGGAFGPAMTYPGSSGAFSVATGEFNGDGFRDLVTANSGSDDVTILPGRGDGSFGEPAHLVATELKPGRIAHGDFDGDGLVDLAVAVRGVYPDTLGGVSILLGDGAGRFVPGATIADASNPLSVVTADFDLDGRLDLAVASSGVFVLSPGGFPVQIFPSDVRIFKGHGDGTFAFRTRFLFQVSPRTLVTDDFDGDGRPDLAVLYALALNDPGIMSVRLGRGDGTFFAWDNFFVGRAPNAIVSADFNHDGHPDLAAANAYADPFSPGDLSVFLNNGDGSFGPERGFGTSGGVPQVDLGDFNGDGELDLAVVNDDYLGFGVRGLSIFLGDGRGSFATQGRFVSLDKAFWVASDDFDGDGRDDVAAIVQNGGAFELRVFPGDGRGGFSEPLRFRSPRGVHPMLSADLNGDGRADLALPVEEGVEILLNESISNRPPRAVATAARTTECVSQSAAPVALDGSGSSDPDSAAGTNDDIVEFEWFESFGTAAQRFLGAGETISVVLGLGDHEITLRVTDRAGATSTATITASVVDTTPPSLSVTLTPATLWPPDHRMVEVEAVVVAEDLCGRASWMLAAVVSDEADDAPGGADGATTHDVQDAEAGSPDAAFALRAERAGSGSGRTYTVSIAAEDEAGLESAAVALVRVPHDLRRGAKTRARPR